MPSEDEAGQAGENTGILESTEGLQVKVKIDGQDKVMPLQEMIDGYNQGTVGNKRMKEASMLRKEAEDAIQLSEDLRGGIARQDPVALRRAFKAGGMTDAQIEMVLTGGQQQQQEPDPVDDDDDNPVVTELRKQQGVMQKQIDALTGTIDTARKKAETNIYQRQVDTVIDGNPLMTKILQDLDSKTDQQWLRSQIYTAVGRRAEMMPWGPRAMEAGLKDVSEQGWFKKLVKAADVGSPQDDDDDVDDSVAFPGLGQSGTTVGSPSNLRAGDKKPVPIFSAGHAQSIGLRVAKKAREARKRAEKG